MEAKLSGMHILQILDIGQLVVAQWLLRLVSNQQRLAVNQCWLMFIS